MQEAFRANNLKCDCTATDSAKNVLFADLMANYAASLLHLEYDDKCKYSRRIGGARKIRWQGRATQGN